jgi:hypothetical protein
MACIAEKLADQGRREDGARQPGRAYRVTVKRLVARVVGMYLLFAVIGRFIEKMGAVECGCDSSCWCKRPILSTFRWVFPYRHRGCGVEKPAGGQAAEARLRP